MEQEFNTTMQTLNILQLEVNSSAYVVLQNQRALDRLISQEGDTCVIMGEKCCFNANQTGQVVSNLNLLRERTNMLHHLNETETFYWTDLVPGLRDWSNGVQGNVLPFILFCLFILILIYVLASLCRSILCREPGMSQSME